MKILLVVDQFFGANNGMTISTRRFAKVLAEDGHEVRVAAVGTPDETPYGMQVLHVPFFDGLVTAQGMTFARPDDTLLYEAVGWADVVHFLVPFWLSHRGIAIARELGVPYTAAFHTQAENVSSSLHLGKVEWVNDLIYRWFYHYVYRDCRHVHCPSHFIADELVRNGYDNVLHVISNGIDPDFVYRKLPKTPQFEGKFVILTVGRYSIEKRQDLLLKAAAKSRYADRIQLVLAGQGPREEALRSLAAELPNPPIMRFFSKPELMDVIAMSDLYVHAADMEIEAMACMEAFAGGLVPVIADSPKSATPQFALDGRSLFDAGSSDSLAERIDYWIEHGDERREMEQRYAELGKKYDLHVCVKQMEEMFRTAIAENEHELNEPVELRI